MMLQGIEARFAASQAPHPIEHLSDNGSPYTAKDTRDFAAALNLRPCFTPVRSPESNGLAEAFVETFKRDYVRVNPLPDANTALRQIAGWIADYNDGPSSLSAPDAIPQGVHPSSGPIAGVFGETGGNPSWQHPAQRQRRSLALPASNRRKVGTMGKRFTNETETDDPIETSQAPLLALPVPLTERLYCGHLLRSERSCRRLGSHKGAVGDCPFAAR